MQSECKYMHTAGGLGWAKGRDGGVAFVLPPPENAITELMKSCGGSGLPKQGVNKAQSLPFSSSADGTTFTCPDVCVSNYGIK